VTDFDFAALGAEAFVPSTKTQGRAFFIYEEVPIGPVKLSLGARHERGGPADPGTGLPRFDPPQALSFNATSGSLGAVYGFAQNFALAVNGAYTQRAPTFYELFANGPHAATGAYEVGSTTFGKEKSKAFDAALRWRSGAHSASIGYFQNRFDNFIALFNSGNTRGADGELNPVDADGDGVADGSGEEILPEFTYRQVPARFRGYEAEGRFRVLERSGTLDVLLRFDYVRADDGSTGLPLPRIAPRRFGAGLDYRYNGFGARLDATWVDDQNRIGANELPTDGYTMVNAALTYRVKLPLHPQSHAEFFLRGTNLLNEEARNHVSILKDIAPLGRRAAMVGVRANF
jgi:iron complex outermembrane receptor protein